MGAWGEEPYDNDTAADALGDFTHKVNLSKHVNKMLGHKDPEVQRAGAFILEGLGKVYVYEIDKLEDDLSYALAKLEDILDDEKWLNRWGKNRRHVQRAIRSQIKNLRANYPGRPEKPIDLAIAQWRK